MTGVRQHSHGSPYDRGSADAYYRRRAIPHYYEGEGAGPRKRIEKDGMTFEQVAEYRRGYAEEDDRKEY